MQSLVTSVILSGAGAGVVVLILARILPNEKLEKWGYAIGAFVSGYLSGKLGKVFWEKIEDFLQNSAGVFLRAIKRGLNSDDKKQPGVPIHCDGV